MAVGRRAQWGAVRPLGGAAAVALALAVLATAGPSWPWLSLVSVATPLLVLAAAACLGGLALRARRMRARAAVAALGVAAVAAAMLFDAGSLWRPVALQDGDPALRILSFNLHRDNESPMHAARWILARDPDVVVLLEAARAGARVSGALAARYPHSVTCRGQRRCSTMILSRRPPLIARGLARGDADNRRALSAAHMRVASAIGPVDIVAVHLSRPWPVGRQAKELRLLGGGLSDVGRDRLLLIGDFNAPPWSMTIRDASAMLGLRRLPTGPTWPVPFGGSPLRPVLAIDHALAGSALAMAHAQTGPALGSDHRPLLVELGRAPG